jgi:hypothetical protein
MKKMISKRNLVIFVGMAISLLAIVISIRLSRPEAILPDGKHWERLERAMDTATVGKYQDQTPTSQSSPDDGKLSIVSFERSPFFQKHQSTDKDQWKLKTGGTNYSYSFPDPENDFSGMGVELNSDPDDVREIGVMWHGQSTLQPPTLTAPKENFLRDLLAASLPKVNSDNVIAYIRSQKGKNYPGGGSVMPRKKISGIKVHTGICGSSLVVGFEK